jgi:fumarate hydratase class II
MTDIRMEADSFGGIEVPADKLWGAQTQRSLQRFSIGQNLIPREMIAAYAILEAPLQIKPRLALMRIQVMSAAVALIAMPPVAPHHICRRDGNSIVN